MTTGALLRKDESVINFVLQETRFQQRKRVVKVNFLRYDACTKALLVALLSIEHGCDTAEYPQKRDGKIKIQCMLQPRPVEVRGSLSKSRLEPRFKKGVPYA